jgi:hypothetical protein
MLTVFLLCRACKPVLTCMQSSAAAALSTWCSIVLRVVTLANSKVEDLLLFFSFLCMGMHMQARERPDG